MATLNYDIDNFSGSNSRGTRYNIYANDVLVYGDVAEDEVDYLTDMMDRRPYLYQNVEVREI